MSRSPRQVFVISAGALCVVVVSFVGVRLWPKLEREYFVYQLRSDPSRLEEMLTAERPSERAAVRKFAQGKAGKKWLFDLYLKEYDRSSMGGIVQNFLIRWRSKAGDFRGFLALWEDGFSCDRWTGPTSQGSLSYATAPENRVRRQKILALIHACIGESFEVEAFNGFEFQVARVTDGTAELPSWPGMQGSAAFLPSTPSIKPSVEYVCFFRRNSE